MRRGDKEAGVALVGLGDDFIGAGDRGGEDGIALQLPPGVDEDSVVGLHPVQEGSVPAGYSRNMLLIEDPSWLVMSKRGSGFQVVLAGPRYEASGTGIKYPPSTESLTNVWIYTDCQQYH